MMGYTIFSWMSDDVQRGSFCLSQLVRSAAIMYTRYDNFLVTSPALAKIFNCEAASRPEVSRRALLWLKGTFRLDYSLCLPKDHVVGCTSSNNNRAVSWILFAARSR
mmetsp:Transcript_11001/g.16551  ORF Transcript_11001/g.16551 Transcript_11001/m.16551 type:complete len:107 (-) Transcript_11001:5-325(-)